MTRATSGQTATSDDLDHVGRTLTAIAITALSSPPATQRSAAWRSLWQAGGRSVPTTAAVFDAAPGVEALAFYARPHPEAESRAD